MTVEDLLLLRFVVVVCFGVCVRACVRVRVCMYVCAFHLSVSVFDGMRQRSRVFLSRVDASCEGAFIPTAQASNTLFRAQ